MSTAEIIVVSIRLIVQVAALTAAYYIGKINGYRERATEEKFARGIR